MGLLQYVAPTGQFLLAVALYRERFTGAHGFAFACIWTSLAIYTWAAFRGRIAERPPRTTLHAWLLAQLPVEGMNSCTSWPVHIGGAFDRRRFLLDRWLAMPAVKNFPGRAASQAEGLA